MTKDEMVRALRDPSYRRSLSAEAQAQLPAHPAGSLMGVEDDVLAGVTGGCCYPGVYSTKPWLCSALCTPCPPRQCY